MKPILPDDASEAESLVVDELHLVRSGANRYPLLLVKQTTDQALADAAAKVNTETKEKAKVSKTDKRLAKMVANNVDLTGGTAASSSRLREIGGLVHQAGSHTRAMLAHRIVDRLDRDVAAAKAALVAAESPFEETFMRTKYKEAAQRRYLAKAVMTDNSGANRGRYGPHSTDLFGGTTLSLGDDSGLRYMGKA